MAFDVNAFAGSPHRRRRRNAVGRVLARRCDDRQVLISTAIRLRCRGIDVKKRRHDGRVVGYSINFGSTRLPSPSSSIRIDVSNTTMTVGSTRLMNKSGSSCAKAVVDHQKAVTTAVIAAAALRRLIERSNRRVIRVVITARPDFQSGYSFACSERFPGGLNHHFPGALVQSSCPRCAIWPRSISVLDVRATVTSTTLRVPRQGRSLQRAASACRFSRAVDFHPGRRCSRSGLAVRPPDRRQPSPARYIGLSI